MSEQILSEILGELKVIKDGQISMGNEIKEIKMEQRSMRGEIKEIKSEQRSMREEIKEIKSEQRQMKTEQQQMKQAILETNDTVKEIAKAQKKFEKRTAEELKTHAYSIEILNREQLQIKSDIEFLKAELKKA